MTQPPSGPPPGGARPRKLYRSRSERMLGGVCGGIAAYLGQDPTVIRVVALLTLLVPGPSIVAYLIAWVIVPEEPWITPPSQGAGR
jgi:phage shock protein C